MVDWSSWLDFFMNSNYQGLFNYFLSLLTPNLQRNLTLLVYDPRIMMIQKNHQKNLDVHHLMALDDLSKIVKNKNLIESVFDYNNQKNFANPRFEIQTTCFGFERWFKSL